MRKTLFSTPFSLMSIIFLITAFCFFGFLGIVATEASEGKALILATSPVQDTMVTVCAMSTAERQGMPGQIIEMAKIQNTYYTPANIRGSTIYSAIVDETNYAFTDITPYHRIILTAYILRGFDAKDIVPSASVQEVYQNETECALTSTNLKFFPVNRTDGQANALRSRAYANDGAGHQATFL